jgi:hypothetical protein
MPLEKKMVLCLSNPDLMSLAQMAAACQEAHCEATILLNHEMTQELVRKPGLKGLVNAIKCLDVGLLGLGSPSFRESEEPAHDALLFASGRMPSCYFADQIPTSAYPVLTEWNTRCVLSPKFNWRHDEGPFFVGSRLHLATHGTTAVQAHADDHDALDAVVQKLPNGFPLVMTLTGGSTENVTTWLKRLEREQIHIQSVRQFADEFADIPYDHSLPFSVLEEFSRRLSATRVLTTFRYEVGFLSPAEQLYLLVSAWKTTVEKGKPPRVIQARTPLPDTKMDRVVGSSQDINKAILNLWDSLSNYVLPMHVETPHGMMSTEDFTATIATHIDRIPVIDEDWQPVSAVLMDAQRADEPEFRRLMWTYKQAVHAHE